MSIADRNAFPIDPRGAEHWAAGSEGLSLREHFAGLAMQGLCASPAYAESPAASIAEMAADQADALIAQLEKPRESSR